jgi:adenylosuccinate lyase
MLKDGSPKINLYVCYTIFVTDFTIFQSPFSSRYGSSEMRKVWSEQHRWDLASKVWTEVARAQHKVGLVSKEELEDLESHIGKIDVERVQELEKETGHDIVAGIRAYQEVAKIGGRIIHHGMTSEDMTTNMDGMRYQEALPSPCRLSM